MDSLSDLLGKNLVSSNGQTVLTGSLCGSDKVIGLYFSAHWCPPCRAFTPKLVEFYNGIKSSEKGNSFEMVFISSDRDQESFSEYFKEMPWLALPFEDRERKVSSTQAMMLLLSCPKSPVFYVQCYTNPSVQRLGFFFQLLNVYEFYKLIIPRLLVDHVDILVTQDVMLLNMLIVLKKQLYSFIFIYNIHVTSFKT